MTFKDIIKGFLPYSIVMKRRNRRKVFSKLLGFSKNAEIPIEQPKFKTVVSVQGFGYSGSGAVLDLLREYSGVQVLGYMDPEATRNSNKKGLAEIDIIRCPGGLFEIENNLEVDNIFINDALFNRTAKLLESSALFSYSADIRELCCTFFKSITSLRITNLTKTYYNGYLHNPDERSNIYFKNNSLSRDLYLKISQNFLRAIFNRISNGSGIIVADQLFSDAEFDIQRNMAYIPDLQTIIVVRDPRDTYAWAVVKNIEWIPHGNVEEFICWYKLQYKNVSNVRNVPECLVVNYENLVLDYKRTISRIESFLTFDSMMHIKKGYYFAPDFSRRFVKIYKEKVSEDELIKINEQLSEFCNSLID